MSEVAHLKTFNVIDPPTSAEVFKSVLNVLDPYNSLEHLEITVLGDQIVPKPKPAKVSMEIMRITSYETMKRILGRTASSQLISLETSSEPSEQATATIVG